MSKAKQTAADAIAAAINKRFGKGSAARLDEGFNLADLREVIPFGIDALDKFVIGRGGLPVGLITELFGDEGAGKTSLALAACASVQALDGLAIYCDTEHALQNERAEAMGVDLSRLVLLQPHSFEEACDHMHEALRNLDGSAPSLLVWDSIAATPPQAELDGDAADKAIGDRARIMGKLMRVFSQRAGKARCAVLLINQTREKIGLVFGDNTTTPGGRGPKFHAVLRVQLWAAKMIAGPGGQPTGRYVTAKAVKNKLAIPHKKAKLLLDFTDGWDDSWSTLALAKELRFVKPRSRAYDDAVQALDAANWRGVGTHATDKDDA